MKYELLIQRVSVCMKTALTEQVTAIATEMENKNECKNKNNLQENDYCARGFIQP